MRQSLLCLSRSTTMMFASGSAMQWYSSLLLGCFCCSKLSLGMARAMYSSKLCTTSERFFVVLFVLVFQLQFWKTKSWELGSALNMSAKLRWLIIPHMCNSSRSNSTLTSYLSWGSFSYLSCNKKLRIMILLWQPFLS